MHIIHPYGHGFMTFPFCGPIFSGQVLDEDSDGAIDREEFRKGLRPDVEIMVCQALSVLNIY